MYEQGGPSSAGRDRPGAGPRRSGTDDLLVAAGRGDLDAFGAFYDATAPMVLGMVARVLERPAPAEQVIEEIYLALWRRAPAFDPAVRSAEATVVQTARRALVRAVVAVTPARRPGDGLRSGPGVRRRRAAPREPES